ncbi:glycoside hydrolase family 19 protein, partial [Aeromonas salmonicida]
ADSDKQALEDCINNKARVSGGQGYLLLNQEVTTYRLTSDSQHGFHDVAKFGPLVLPFAVKESDKVSHGANNFVKVRERTAADGELAGEFVLLADGVEVVSQHDWHKLGVKLVDGSSDEDGFLDKADTATDSEDSQQKEASEFFSTLYDKLVTYRDNDGTLSGNDIKAALADEELAGKLRRVFIKHKSEWVKPGDWPRLEQELADQPKLYEYAKQVHNNMAWMEDVSAIAILGDTKPWFIHPAGMMGLVANAKRKEFVTVAMLRRVFEGLYGKTEKQELLAGIAEQINENAIEYKLDTTLRLSHFFAQVRQEAGAKCRVEEDFTYSSSGLIDLFSYFSINRSEAELYGYKNGVKYVSRENQEAIANRAYANRNGNGSVFSGEGWKYRGRGLKQLTGKSNYEVFRQKNLEIHGENVDFINNPDLLSSDVKYALRSAVSFWLSNRLYLKADQGDSDANVDSITAIVNLNTGSYQERKNHFKRIHKNEKIFN